MEYYHKRIDDPRMEKMIDLKTMPISHWPSSEVYHAFNEYLFFFDNVDGNVGGRGHVN